MFRIIVPIGLVRKLVYSMDQFAGIVFTDTGGQMRNGGGISGVRESPGSLYLPIGGGLSIIPPFDIRNHLCQTLHENGMVGTGATTG
jgi:hypothetical protein